ncbi:MAG: hypothetical protein NVV83_01530 [Afipia sp.]|nr:hypothetical protein [Afipia sp.]
MEPREIANSRIAYYFCIPRKFKLAGCTVKNEALGTDYAKACKRAEVLNGQFDEWCDIQKGLPVEGPSAPRVGTVDWLFKEYKQSNAYLEKVAERSRGNYEWVMLAVCDTLNKQGVRIGSLPIKSISPRAADKLYNKFTVNSDGKTRLRVAEKMTVCCRKAWRVVHRLHPAEFNKDVPNPWVGVTMKTRVKLTKHAVTRDEVYTFAHGAVALGEPEVAAIAVICFEWLQRPENVIAGSIKWNDYRGPANPTKIIVAHHKTGTVAPHPLQETLPDGTVIKFYEEAEEILSHLKKRGVPLVLRAVDDDTSKTFSFSGMQKIVQRVRGKLKMSPLFTLDACRHGGMTELEEAELTDGQGRALSTHKTQESYTRYAKRTERENVIRHAETARLQGRGAFGIAS